MNHAHPRRRPAAAASRAALAGVALIAGACTLPGTTPGPTTTSTTTTSTTTTSTTTTTTLGTLPAPAGLQAALDRIVADGAPGILVRVRHDDNVATLVSGVGTMTGPPTTPATTTTTTSPDRTSTTGPTSTTVRATTTTAGPTTTTTRARPVGVAVRPDDRYRIASQTKTFVATVLLQLAADKDRKVPFTLDDSVEKWLPGTVKNGEGITVRHLLNHTSGLYDYLNNALEDAPTELDVPVLAPYFVRGEVGHVWTPEQLAALVKESPRRFEPPGCDQDGCWEYSNTNYVLAGMIVEKVSGNPLAVEIKRRILDPLGLRQTSFPTTDSALPEPHLSGYHVDMPKESSWPTGTDVTRLSPSIFAGAGSGVSTAGDLETFYRALLAGRLLSTDQLAQMRTLVGRSGDAYALGLERRTLRSGCGFAWGHSGSAWGYLSETLVSEDGHRQIELVTNFNPDKRAALNAEWNAVVALALCGETGPPLATPPAIAARQRAYAGIEPPEDN